MTISDYEILNEDFNSLTTTRVIVLEVCEALHSDQNGSTTHYHVRVAGKDSTKEHVLVLSAKKYAWAPFIGKKGLVLLDVTHPSNEDAGWESVSKVRLVCTSNLKKRDDGHNESEKGKWPWRLRPAVITKCLTR